MKEEKSETAATGERLKMFLYEGREGEREEGKMVESRKRSNRGERG